MPFFVRVGKRLPVSVTEILVRFKHTRRPVLDEMGPPLANYFRFRLAPEMVLALGTKVKRPGDALAGERIEMVAHHQRPDEMPPYERLLERRPTATRRFSPRGRGRTVVADRQPDSRRRDAALPVHARHLGPARGRSPRLARRRLVGSSRHNVLLRSA